MMKNRSYSIAFKRQVAEEYLAGAGGFRSEQAARPVPQPGADLGAQVRGG